MARFHQDDNGYMVPCGATKVPCPKGGAFHTDAEDTAGANRNREAWLREQNESPVVKKEVELDERQLRAGMTHPNDTMTLNSYESAKEALDDYVSNDVRFRQEDELVPVGDRYVRVGMVHHDDGYVEPAVFTYGADVQVTSVHFPNGSNGFGEEPYVALTEGRHPEDLPAGSALPDYRQQMGFNELDSSEDPEHFRQVMRNSGLDVEVYEMDEEVLVQEYRDDEETDTLHGMVYRYTKPNGETLNYFEADNGTVYEKEEGDSLWVESRAIDPRSEIWDESHKATFAPPGHAIPFKGDADLEDEVGSANSDAVHKAIMAGVSEDLEEASFSYKTVSDRETDSPHGYFSEGTQYLSRTMKGQDPISGEPVTMTVDSAPFLDGGQVKYHTRVSTDAPAWKIRALNDAHRDSGVTYVSSRKPADLGLPSHIPPIRAHKEAIGRIATDNGEPVIFHGSKIGPQSADYDKDTPEGSVTSVDDGFLIARFRDRKTEIPAVVKVTHYDDGSSDTIMYLDLPKERMGLARKALGLTKNGRVELRSMDSVETN